MDAGERLAPAQPVIDVGRVTATLQAALEQSVATVVQGAVDTLRKEATACAKVCVIQFHKVNKQVIFCANGSIVLSIHSANGHMKLHLSFTTAIA